MRSSTTTLQAASPDEQELSCLLALQKALAVREPPRWAVSAGLLLSTHPSWESSRQAAVSSSAQGQHQHTSYKLTALQVLTPGFHSHSHCPPRSSTGLGQGQREPGPSTRPQREARAQHSDQGTHHQGEGFPCDHAAFGLTRAEPSLPEGRADQTHCSVTQAAQRSSRSRRGDSPTPPSPFRTGQGTAQPLRPSGRKVQSRMTQLGQKSTPAQGLQDI